MTEPNEEVNEELSTEELKSVSGGVSGVGVEIPRVTNRQKKGKKGRNPNDPRRSGSGMTTQDWEKWSDGLDLNVTDNDDAGHD